MTPTHAPTPTRLLAAALLALTGGLLSACAVEPSTEGEKRALTATTSGTLATFKAKDPSLAALIDKSVGYMVFPSIGKGGFIVGGSYGRGEAYEHGKRIGYADITQGSFGALVGGQSFAELVLFMTEADLAQFKKGEFSLAANLSAVALKSGAAATTDPKKTVIVFVDAEAGLMVDASIGGQVMKFKAY